MAVEEDKHGKVTTLAVHFSRH